MTTPGIHPSINMGSFSPEEEIIVRNLSKEWYITNGGSILNLGMTSKYRYFLMRPTDIYTQMFNIDRDIVVVFSDYEIFQSRSLDAFDTVPNLFKKLRIEKICGVLISRDSDVENKLKKLLKNEQETLAIVPFSYDELFEINDIFFLRNRFKSHFYTRDLFAFESPLRKELFFFGRHDLIHNIVNRHLSSENSGLFGLRKTGKTSVIFGIQRSLLKQHSPVILIDCQNPAFHRRRWFEALEYLINETIKQLKLNKNIKTKLKYSEIDSAINFENDILAIYGSVKRKSLLFIFDEIENISYKTSSSEHWNSGLDFIYFWQTLRSIFQKHENIYTYLLVGTNPVCVEIPSIQGKDNPIFSQVPFQYIPRFDVQKTSEMLNKLGKIMGISFEDILFSRITEDYGGHPFLIRHVCSVINRVAPSTRPLHVDKALYEYAKGKFDNEYTKFFDMILNVLEKHFTDEFEMLKYLARGEIDTFYEFAQSSPELTNHLIGYGIIDFRNGRYSFRIDSIKNYILNKEKYKKLNLTQKEIIKEVSERRNQIESKLRHLIKNQLKAFYGKSKAVENFLKIIPEKRKQKMKKLSFDELFDANKNEIYFDDLKIIVLKNWDVFKYIFDSDNKRFEQNMDCINKYRIDAHAKKMDIDELQYYRISIGKLEKQVNEFS